MTFLKLKRIKENKRKKPNHLAHLLLHVCPPLTQARDQNTVVSKLITDRHFFLGGINSNCRYRIALPEELISITKTDLWECQQKISHYRCRFSLDIQLISITDTELGLKQINSVTTSATTVSTKQTSPRTKSFKHIATSIVQEHLLQIDPLQDLDRASASTMTLVA